MKLKENFLLYTLLPLTILFIAASYVRFLVTYDYLVTYEVECDPQTQSCFIGCEDDECLEEYYYKNITKKAHLLNEQWGKDITDCQAANICLPEDKSSCVISYCDPNLADTECISTDLTEDIDL